LAPTQRRAHGLAGAGPHRQEPAVMNEQLKTDVEAALRHAAYLEAVAKGKSDRDAQDRKAPAAAATHADELRLLFAGRDDAYGTFYGKPAFNEAKKKWEFKASKVDAPVTVELWEKHILGELILGIYLLNENDECKWGSIDIDEYRDDLTSVIVKIEKLKLPLIACYSKSGGLHLFVFFKEWTPAARVKEELQKIASMLGLAGCEIFPKQTNLEPGGYGNWIAMPYFGNTFDGKLKEQVGVKRTGAEMTLGEFLIVANKNQVSIEDLAAAVK